MAKTVQSDNMTNTAGTGAVNFPFGLTSAGAVNISGNLTNSGGTAGPSLPFGFSGGISARYTGYSAPASYSGTATQIIFSTLDYDTNSLYNPSTGLFTVPAGQAGKYQIRAVYNGADNTDTDVSSVMLYKNGAPGVGINVSLDDWQVGGTNNQSFSVEDTLNLNAGDTIGVWALCGHTVTLRSTNATDFRLTINKIG